MLHPQQALVLAAFALLGLAAPAAQAQDAPTAKPKVKAKGAPAPPVAAAGTPQAPPPPPAAGGPRPPQPGQPGPGPQGPGPGLRKGGVQALSDFTGTLTGYTATNDDQVYDAFDFKTSAGTETVRFPRHLGQALLAAAKPGSSVTISGFRDTDPLGRSVLHLVSLSSGGQTVRDTPPARPATPPAEEATTVHGAVQQLSKDPQGHVTAAVLADGTVLRLPPAAAEQLADKLKTGAPVAVTGVLRQPGPGEVAARPVRVVRAQTITLDGVQFLVR